MLIMLDVAISAVARPESFWCLWWSIPILQGCTETKWQIKWYCEIHYQSIHLAWLSEPGSASLLCMLSVYSWTIIWVYELQHCGKQSLEGEIIYCPVCRLTVCPYLKRTGFLILSFRISFWWCCAYLPSSFKCAISLYLSSCHTFKIHIWK